jgi:hypothetical protein
MSTKRPLIPDARQSLLKELSSYASPSFVAQAAASSTDAQIASYIAGAKAQLESRRRAGIRDLRQAKA